MLFVSKLCVPAVPELARIKKQKGEKRLFFCAYFEIPSAKPCKILKKIFTKLSYFYLYNDAICLKKANINPFKKFFSEHHFGIAHHLDRTNTQKLKYYTTSTYIQLRNSALRFKNWRCRFFQKILSETLFPFFSAKFKNPHRLKK